MFSGLKYIFGYADETDQQTTFADSTNQSELLSSNTEQHSSTDLEQQTINTSAGSALLEKTLNAATTKFTERLLPPQATIEELLSSSQHLLPSLTEQDENDELKKAKEIKDSFNVNNEGQEDDCLEVDSWELLDLVEKADVGKDQIDCGLDSTVQLDESSFEICKSTTNGILKFSNNNNNDTKATSANVQPTRQKPKVSFETPDLVRSSCKQNKKIEQLGKQTELKATKSVKGKNKRNNQPTCIHAAAEKTEQSSGTKIEMKLSCEQKSGTIRDSDFVEICPVKISSSNDKSGLVLESSDRTVGTSSLHVTNEKPVLNYAAALSKKPVEWRSETVNKETKMVMEELKPGCSTNAQVRGSKKRNRTLSTSSWSSSEQMCHEYVDDSTGMVNESCITINDDDESVISSGFSDCDYGYEGINDYYLRPKRSNSKRGHCSSSISSSNSSSLLASLSKRGNDRARIIKNNSKVATPSKELKCSDTTQVKSARVHAIKSNVSRPKKKKINLSASSSQDFSKKISASKQPDCEDIANKTLELTNVSASNNDSSDIAEMDESWYVTPPPCFTGANRSERKIVNGQPKAKEAARENELIEHPSVPLSSKVAPCKAKNSHEKLSVVASKQMKPSTYSFKSSISNADWGIDCNDDDSIGFDLNDDNWITAGRHADREQGKQKHARREVIKSNKVPTKKVASTSVEKVQQQEEKSTKNDYRDVRMIGHKKAAWKNKFSVDDWDLDDCEDADSDFDNMFEPIKKKEATKKAKKQRSQARKNERASKVNSGDQSEAGLESDVSIDIPKLSYVTESKFDCAAELISIRSCSSFDSPINLDAKTNIIIDEKENQVIATVDERRPIQVRPIEPERKPGWQLKRQRCKRRPLAGSCSALAGQIIDKQQMVNGRPRLSNESKVGGNGGSSGSSARSSPTLIDRIGSSIVANLNNLTNGLVSSGALHSRPVAQLVEDTPRVSAAHSTASKSFVTETCNLVVRKRMSKGHLKRKNICAKYTNSQRRPDRRSKMFAIPNGCSVNRKVQSNFH